MAKKYISKIIKGGNDIFIKDTEARDAIAELGAPEYNDVYMGISQSISIQDFDYYEAVKKGKPVTVTSGTGYLWVMIPSDNLETPTVFLGGIQMPMVSNGIYTVESKTYNVWKSVNTYSSALSIVLQ